MDIFLITLLAGLLIIIASLSGIVTANNTLRKYIEKNISYFLTFAGGVFLILSLGLVIEANHLLDNWGLVTCFVVVGFLSAELVTRLLPETHHHGNADCASKHSRYKIIIGDSLHNIIDGFLLAASFMVSPLVGIMATLSVFAHEFVQEISEFFVLRASGLSIFKSLLINFTVSLSIFIGILLAFSTGENPTLQSILMTISAGIFLHIFFLDLMPHRHVQHKSHLGRHTAVLLLSIVLMSTLAYALGHRHGDEHADDHNHNHNEHNHENNETIINTENELELENNHSHNDHNHS